MIRTPHVRRPAGFRTLVGSIVVASLTIVAPQASVADDSSHRRALDEPVLAFSGELDGLDQVWTAALDGTVLQRFTQPVGFGEQFNSIGSGLVAVTEHRAKNPFASRVVVSDAATGELHTRVGDARYPLLLWDGAGLMFLSDNSQLEGPNERDPYHSVWFRNLSSGEEVRLARVKNADYRVGQFAASPARDLLAFVRGNETGLFRSDIVVVEPDGENRRRLTTGGRSLAPSFSPDGQTIAMQKRSPIDEPCTGGLATIGVDGTGEHRFYDAPLTCDRNLLRPIWINDVRVVAWWWSFDPNRGGQPRGLVFVNTETGHVSKPLVEGPVFDFSVSRDRRLIAWRFPRGRIQLYDIGARTVRTFPGGLRLPGANVHIDGSLELP